MAGTARRAVPDSVQIAVSPDECFCPRNSPNTRNSRRRLFFLRVVRGFRGRDPYHLLAAHAVLSPRSFAKAGTPKAKANYPPGVKEFETRITRILTNRMNPLVEIGAIRVYASAFASFRVFCAQTSNLLRIIRVNESRFQIRLIRVIRGLSRRLVRPEPCAKAEASWRRRIKNSVLLKNFRELRPEFPGTDGE